MKVEVDVLGEVEVPNKPTVSVDVMYHFNKAHSARVDHAFSTAPNRPVIDRLPHTHAPQWKARRFHVNDVQPTGNKESVFSVQIQLYVRSS